MAQNRQSNEQTGSILDVIHEKAANIEQTTNVQNIKLSLNEAIKILARKERSIREATITFKLSEFLVASKAIQLIEAELDKCLSTIPPTFWQDKEALYCQLDSAESKNVLLDQIRLSENSTQLQTALMRPNNLGQHFQRKPIKLEIQNLRSNLKADTIREAIKYTASESDAELIEFKEGKPHPITKNRSIYFRVNGPMFKHIFCKLDGAIPYSNRSTNTRIKLMVKINCKPFTCRECNQFGGGPNHRCAGKSCTNCGLKDHLARECKSKTKFCSNCKRKGHRSKDSHCPTLLNEVSKEIRKADIPLEFLEEKELRTTLIKHLQTR